MKIHVIGDSHVMVFDGIDPFVAVHIPMATAHNLISDTSTSNSKRILLEYLDTADEGDYVLLYFGEIDCRFQFYPKSRILTKSVSEMIEATIARYAEAIEVVLQQKSRNNVAIVNIVPAGDWNRTPPERALYGFPHPITPSEKLIEINREFHDNLAKICRARGYNLIDIWDDIVDTSGFTKEEYVGCDPVHLNKNTIPLFKREINRVFGTDLE